MIKSLQPHNHGKYDSDGKDRFDDDNKSYKYMFWITWIVMGQLKIRNHIANEIKKLYKRATYISDTHSRDYSQQAFTHSSRYFTICDQQSLNISTVLLSLAWLSTYTGIYLLNQSGNETHA